MDRGANCPELAIESSRGAGRGCIRIDRAAGCAIIDRFEHCVERSNDR
jgi:hypothetical protein